MARIIATLLRWGTHYAQTKGRIYQQTLIESSSHFKFSLRSLNQDLVKEDLKVFRTFISPLSLIYQIYFKFKLTLKGPNSK